MAERATWATRVGFVLAAVGSAVGLGNVWRFPFQVGEGGGAAFLVVYLVFVALVGLSVLLAELAVGRSANRSPVEAFADLAQGAWEHLGWLFVATAFILLSYYTVVAGWIARYAVKGVSAGYPSSVEAADTQFAAAATGVDAVVFHGLFMAATAAVVGLGLRRGVELAAKVTVPVLVVLLVALAVYVSDMSGAGAAYSYYLSPDFGEVAANWDVILPAAAGQAFFTLSLGMGVMITYASYIEKDEDIVRDGAAIVALDSFIAVLVGLIVFPVLFTAGMPPAEPGHGAVFVSLAAAFGGVPMGGGLGTVFFATVALAALLSTVGLMEVVVSHILDYEGVERRAAAGGVGLTLFVVGIPAASSLVVIDFYDLFVNRVLLVAGALLLSVYVGWRFRDEAVSVVSGDSGWLDGFGRAWLWTLRIPVVVVLVVVLGFGIADYVGFVQEIAETFASR